MEVGIIGLKPRQAAQLEAMNFKASIAFYPHETFDQIRVSAFCRAHDDIVLLSGHVPRRLAVGVPAARTKLIPGNVGISSVIAHLEQRYGYQDNAAPAKVETVETETPVAAPVPAKKNTTLAGWKYSLVVGHAAHYDPHNTEHASIERPSAGGRFSYSHLAALRPGDLLRYPRNPGETDSAAYQRFQYLRKTQLQAIQGAVEIHVFEEYVDLFVARAECAMGDAASWKRISKQRMLLEMMDIGRRLEERYRAQQLAVVETEESETVNDTPVEAVEVLDVSQCSEVGEVSPVWKGAMAKLGTVPVNVEAPVTTTQPRLSVEERVFWERVYVAAVTAGADPEAANRYAAQAVEHLKAI